LNHPTYQRIYAVVRRIPRGRVSTYGAIARAARASGARQVGYAMHALGGASKLPWYRVINAQGRVSLPGVSGELQREKLRGEGIEFSARGVISLARFGWVAPES
jgi:methylated-DNA-protein-cysteine methyltransferase-like protein